MSYIYLAGPYSHPDPAVREDRAIKLTEICARLMREGKVVYSPITHGHWMAERFELPKEWEFWRLHCEAMLLGAHRLVIVTLPGWNESIGVTAEYDLALIAGIPVEYIHP